MKEGPRVRVSVLLAAALSVGMLLVWAPAASAAPARVPKPGSSSQAIEPHPSAPGSSSSNSKLRTSSGGIPWVWQNPQPSANGLYALSCPTTSNCWAGGFDEMAVTSDGGAHWQTSPSAYEINAISCADTTHCVAVGNSGVVLTSTDGVNFSPQVINGGGFLAGVSCPTAMICYTTGYAAYVLKSTDGGMSWTSQGQPNVGAAFFAISCASTTFCVAVGANASVSYTTDGATWNSSGANGVTALYGVACTGGGCVAVGHGTGTSGTDGGVIATTSNPQFGWFTGSTASGAILTAVSCSSSPTVACFASGLDGSVYPTPGFNTPSPTYYAHGFSGANGALFSISCPRDVTCFTSGDFGTIAVTTTGGLGWSMQFSFGATSSYGVSCPSTTVCFMVAFGGLVARTTDGTNWSSQTSNTSANLRGISCSSTTVCVAVGDGGSVINTADGMTWAPRSSGVSTSITGVSCPSTTTCYAVTTGFYLKSTDGGTTWISAMIGGTSGETGISCPSTSLCFVTVASTPGQVYSTSDGGTTWSLSFDLGTDTQAGISAPFNSIGCPTVNTCYAVGGSGLIATTNDGGARWHTDGPNSSATLTGVSCSAEGTCDVSALDETILRTTDYGADWDIQMGQVGFYSVSCPSSTTCYAAGGEGSANKTSNAGAAWTVQRPTGSTSEVRSVTCVGFRDCYAAALRSVLVSHDGGGTWTEHTLNTTDLVQGVTCATASTCYAVGWPSVAYKTSDGGATWTAQTTASYAGIDETFISVSCSDSTHCVAVGTDGLALVTTDGSTWVEEATGSPGVLWSIACASATSCIAVGSAGNVAKRTSGTWSVMSSGSSRTLTGIRCPTSAICYATGAGGTLLTSSNGGSTWTARTSGTTASLYGVDCSGPATCIAVGNGGTALITSNGGSSWAALSPPTVNGLRAVSFKDAEHVLLTGLGGTIIGIASCSSATLTSDLASPQAGGAKPTFTATATGPFCNSPLFQFWIWTAANGWQVRQPYGLKNQFQLDTTGMAPGTYTVDVWVENSGSFLGTANYETFGLESWVVGGCDFASMSPNPGGTSGTDVFTVTAGGAGCSAPQYQFWLYSVAGGWQLKQAYSASNSWSIDTSTLAAGTYSVDVWVRQQGSPLQYETWALSTIPKGACGSNATTTITPTQASPQAVGTTVNLSTLSTCGASPSYRYWTFPGQANSWQALSAYGPSGALNWNTTGWKPGTQSLDVHVTKVAPTTSSPNPDTWGLLSYSLLGCASVGLAASPPSPQSLGTMISLNATPGGAGCSAPQYQFWYYAGGWHMVQAFSSNATYNWDTTNVAPGTYAWVVYIKQAGDANTYDSYALLSVTVG